jgi:membrane protein
MLIVPVLFVAAGSVTVLLTTRIAAMVESLAFLGYAGTAIIFLVKLAPYAVIWVLFTFMFAFMPNTKVAFKSALWGGIVAGTIYQLAQLTYIKFQLGVSSYGAVYGSFAALPLFLVWLQLSWLIVLFGAEISFAQQNVSSFEFEADCSNVSHSFKRSVAVLVTRHCVKAFLTGEKPPTAETIAEALEVPVRLIRASLFELTEARLLSEIGSRDSGLTSYQPGCSLDDLTVAKILQRLDHLGSDNLPLAESSTLTRVRGILAEFEDLNESSPVNLRLQEL